MVNLSDIYAMNAMATQVTVSLAISNRFPLEALEEFYEGVALACKLYNVDCHSGDKFRPIVSSELVVSC